MILTHSKSNLMIKIEGFPVRIGEELYAKIEAQYLKGNVIDILEKPSAIKLLRGKHAKWYAASVCVRTKPTSTLQTKQTETGVSSSSTDPQT